jgi:PAS domain S-box-containing protein
VNERYRAAYDGASAAAGGRYEAEFRIRRADDGAERWVVTTGRVLFDDAGRPTRGVGTLRDTTARHAAEAAVRESEARYRALVETSPDAVYAHRDGTIVLANRQAAALFGAPGAEALAGRRVFDLVDAASLAAARARTASLTKPGDRAELAALTYRRLDGTAFPVEAAAAAVRLDGRVVVQVVFRDVSARHAAEERQRLLTRELSHRVKNTLAVVQGIASQTLTGGRDLVDARTVLARRLRALANAHGLLTASEWRGASLAALVGDELEPYDGRAVLLASEDVTLGPRAALTLALVLHELTTNAAKHGALSVPGGRVELSWSGAAASDDTFRLAWREAGGPRVRPPTGAASAAP